MRGIGAVNRTAVLPDRDIEVIHRSDGSGTAMCGPIIFPSVSPEWKAAVGAIASQMAFRKGRRGQ